MSDNHSHRRHTWLAVDSYNAIVSEWDGTSDEKKNNIGLDLD